MGSLGGPEAALKILQVVILSPIAILVITAARLLLIANYDPTTALAIAESEGVVGTLVGTTIPLLPPYLPVTTLLFLVFRKYGLCTVAALATLLISPAYGSPADAWKNFEQRIYIIIDQVRANDWQSIAGTNKSFLMVATASLFLAAVYAARRDDPDIPVDSGTFLTRWLVPGFVIAVSAAAAVLFAQTLYKAPFDLQLISDGLRKPWIPAERLGLEQGEVKVAYTLSNEEDWFLILNESDRRVEYLVSESVKTRQVCSVKSPEDPALPLIALKGVKPSQSPACGEPTSPTPTS